MRKLLPLLLALCLGLVPAMPALAGQVPTLAAENPFLGEYTLRTIFVDESIYSFRSLANQTDGNRKILAEDAYTTESVKGEPTHTVDPVVYLIETLDEAAYADTVGRWQIADEAFRLAYDTRMVIRYDDGNSAWDADEFYAKDGRLYWVHIDKGVVEDDPWKVYYIWEMIPKR